MCAHSLNKLGVFSNNMALNAGCTYVLTLISKSQIPLCCKMHQENKEYNVDNCFTTHILYHFHNVH